MSVDILLTAPLAIENYPSNLTMPENIENWLTLFTSQIFDGGTYGAVSCTTPLLQ